MPQANVAELRALAEVFGQAADHHDATKPQVTHDLAALANRAAGVTQSSSGFLQILLESPATVALIQAAIAALLAKLTAPKPAPAPQPQPAPPPTIVAPAPTPAPPTAPAPALLYPTDLRIDLEITGPDGELIPFSVDEKADHYAVSLHGSTTNLPLHSVVMLRAGYCLRGVPFRFEDQTPPALHLYHTARWIAREVGGQGRVSTLAATAKVYAQFDGRGGRIVNWNNEAEQPREATRTGGMDVPMKVPAEANESVFEVDLEVDTPSGTVRHDKPVRFPKAS